MKNVSGKRGSNPPPTAWKAVALPNELLPQRLKKSGRGRIRTSEGLASRFTVCPIWPLWNSPIRVFRSALRADRGTWTHDRLITNQLLYQLSYIGTALSKNSLCFEAAKIRFFPFARPKTEYFLYLFYNSLIINDIFLKQGDMSVLKWFFLRGETAVCFLGFGRKASWWEKKAARLQLCGV